MTCKEMLKIIEKAVYSSDFKIRQEGEEVPQGLSLTDTGISQHWYYREENTIHIYHRRHSDNHECFSTESH